MRCLLHSLLFFCLLFSVTGKPLKVACVGDSITYGAGIEHRESQSYPAQLQDILGVDFEVRNFGRSSATMLRVSNLPYWVTPQFEQAREFLPDIVILKLGTNDSKPLNWDFGRSRFGQDCAELVASFADLQSHPLVYICLPIPAFELKWGIRPYIIKHELIPIIEEVSLMNGIEVIDLYTAMVEQESLVPDKIHPNAEGAAIIARVVASQILSAGGSFGDDKK